MRITKIEIKNFKAFHGTYTINLDNEKHANLLVYGENGSGKSSLSNALKAFFKSAIDNNYNLQGDEFKFLAIDEKDSVEIKIYFRNMSELPGSGITEHFVNLNSHNHEAAYIQYVGKVLPFIDYRNLLDTHYAHREKDTVNIFDVLVKGLLYHYPNRHNEPTINTIGSDWEKLDQMKHDKTARNKGSDFQKLLPKFKNAIGGIIEDIQKELDRLLPMFNNNIKIELEVGKLNIEQEPENRIWKDNYINLKVKYNNTDVPVHQNFLNEARLSSIAIALYLAIVKKITPQANPFKLMFLDDVLIGLDNSNRSPLLEILNSSEFEDYQIFLTTYARFWFETTKNWLKSYQVNSWKFIEMYVDKDANGFDIPKILQSDTYIAKAYYYIQKFDYPAAANNFRKALEQMIQNNVPAVALKNKNGATVGEIEDLITYTTTFYENINRDPKIFSQIKYYKDYLINPLSHHDLRPHINRNDIENIYSEISRLEQTIENLKDLRYKKLLKPSAKIRLEFKLSDEETSVYDFEIKKELCGYKFETDSLVSLTKVKIVEAIYFQKEKPDETRSKPFPPKSESIEEFYHKMIDETFKRHQLTYEKKQDYYSDFYYFEDGKWEPLVDLVNTV